MTHPLAASAVAAAAWTTRATAEAKNALKRNKYSRTGTGACRFVPPSRETYGRAGPEAFALLNEIAEYASGIGSVSKKVCMENAMRDLSTILCRGVARQVIASMPLQAQNEREAVVGLLKSGWCKAVALIKALLISLKDCLHCTVHGSFSLP